MNNVIPEVMPKAAQAAADSPAAGAKPAAPALDLFRAALTGSLTTLRVPVKPAPAAPAAADSPALRAIGKKIAKMLEAGASQADVVATLAAQLAAAIAPAVETPGADARGQLQTVFAQALAPPGNADGAGGSIAERARTLAQRYMKVADAAGAVAEKPNGQQKRISGKFLDARPAKEIPAPMTTASAAALPATAQTATAAASVTAAASATATALSTAVDPAHLAFAAVANVVPAVKTTPDSAGAGDGKRVNIGSATPVATGGDTLLGRILTRATLVADARQTAAAPLAPVAAAAPAATAVAAAPAASADTALSAFIRSFEAALHAGTQPGAAELAAAPAPAAPVAAADASAMVPVAAPFAIDRAQPAVAPAAAASPAAPIDHSAIADQVLRGALLRNVGESSEMRLTLVPETLGDVSVKLVVTAGNVTAHVVAQTSEVRDALVAAQPQLTKSLADAGLKLTSFSVDVSGGGFAGFAQQQNGQPRDGRGNAHPSGLGADTDEADETSIEAIPSFAPSTVARGAGDYNYLA